jgi:hypothetical protein
MIYYVFKEQIFTIFLSMAHLTAVTFPTPVNDYVGGQGGDFKIYELNKSKSLVFESKRKGFNANFITFLKRKKYHFNVTYDERFGVKDVVIRQAKKCSYFSLIKETKDYKLFECPRSLFIDVKRREGITVNGEHIFSKKYLSKGPSLFLKGKLIYHKGRAL